MNIMCNNKDCPSKNVCSTYRKSDANTQGDVCKHHYRLCDGKCEFFQNNYTDTERI